MTTNDLKANLYISKKIPKKDIWGNQPGTNRWTPTFEKGDLGSVKGDKYFAETEFNEGKDEYHKKRSEYTETSESLSEIQSTQKSESQLASLLSEENSTSIKESRVSQ